MKVYIQRYMYYIVYTYRYKCMQELRTPCNVKVSSNSNHSIILSFCDSMILYTYRCTYCKLG